MNERDDEVIVEEQTPALPEAEEKPVEVDTSKHWYLTCFQYTTGTKKPQIHSGHRCYGVDRANLRNKEIDGMRAEFAQFLATSEIEATSIVIASISFLGVMTSAEFNEQ